MQIFAGGSVMGGSQDGFDTALAETHPISDPQEIEEAIAYANEALEVAQRLREAELNNEMCDPSSSKLLQVAVESYIERFEIPPAALESADDYNDDGARKQEAAASRLKKVILYLYAAVERVFKAIFDTLTNHKIDARRIMPLTKQYIGHADSLSAAFPTQLNIRDRSLMVALHIDGLAPRKVADQFQKLADTFEQQYAYSPVAEIVRLVSAARAKNEERVQAEAVLLRDKLEAGFKDALELVDPARVPVFINEMKNPATQFYASDAMFGQNYITGVIGKEVRPNGTFTYYCGIRRDAEVPLRAPGFPCLTPDEIRAVCRISLRVCENIIRFSRDEELIKRTLRDAAFLTTSSPDKSSVVALRNMTAVGQNCYIAHLRYVTRTMQALMRWCAQSIKRHEEVKK